MAHVKTYKLSHTYWFCDITCGSYRFACVWLVTNVSRLIAINQLKRLTLFRMMHHFVIFGNDGIFVKNPGGTKNSNFLLYLYCLVNNNQLTI